MSESAISIIRHYIVSMLVVEDLSIGKEAGLVTK